MSDIVTSWRSPRSVIARHLQHRASESFAFSLLVAFLILAFVALWPNMSRKSFLYPEVPLAQRMLAAGLALLASIPLWYLVAALSRVLAQLLGGKGSYLGARLALFTALLSTAPLMLVQGALNGFLGQGLLPYIAGLVVLGGFLYLWFSMLMEAETRP